MGSNLIEHWLPAGHDILVIDNFATGKRETLPETDGLMVIEGSVADDQLMRQAFSSFKPEIVIHSAAAYKDPSDWIEDTTTNVIGAICVAKESQRQGVKKIVNFQTALCYGRPDTIPIPGDHPVSPFTSYGISKTAGEAYLLGSGVPVVSLRLANICGPRLAIGPIPTFYKRLRAGQNCFCSDTVRDFLDMDDFFSLMDILLDNSSVPTGVYNVSTGEGHTIKDIYDVVAKYLGIDAQDVPIVAPGDDDVAKVVLDPSVTKRVFGWVAKRSFKETIERQLKWYDEYGVNDVFSHLSAPQNEEE